MQPCMRCCTYLCLLLVSTFTDGVGETSVPHHLHEHHARPNSSLPPFDSLFWEPFLGHANFHITTGSPAAQRRFNIGLLLIYNFNQAEARAAFEAALQADRMCAMCAWGVAHTYGPFLNSPTKGPEELALGFDSAQNASRLLKHRKHSGKEHAFINTMAVRYPKDPQTGDQLASYKHYATFFRNVRETDVQLRSDPDLMVFDAEAAMVLMCDGSGHHFYESHGDYVPPTEKAATKEASALLRAALVTTNQSHMYAQHLLIHSTEESNTEAASSVSVAFQLLKNTAALQDQHLQHMSSHTFFRTGRYHEAIAGNKIAVASDAAFLRHGLNPYGPGHNLAFLVCSALWGGERSVAYRYSAELQQLYTKTPSLQDDPSASLAWSYPMMVAVRFGDWDHVPALDARPPEDFAQRWPFGFGILRSFSLGVAVAHLGRKQEAAKHFLELQSLLPRAVQESATVANLSYIANHTATAVLAHMQGDTEATLSAMRLATDVEMGMPYSEPPLWLLPSRECHGQALLEAGRPAEAEKIFRSALYGYSFHAEFRCGWALFGLRLSLQRQAATAVRMQEILNLSAQINDAWQYADVPLDSPCLHLDSNRKAILV
mmetsp:Transcript_123757/g.240804  ORF Transcript_123757/g.240804 Transcript_123757/m.240804 type:complete len:602 (-) Transcript_123757:272-2077(-)